MSKLIDRIKHKIRGNVIIMSYENSNLFDEGYNKGLFDAIDVIDEEQAKQPTVIGKSAEEIAEQMYQLAGCRHCNMHDKCDEGQMNCKKTWLEWLEGESE